MRALFLAAMVASCGARTGMSALDDARADATDAIDVTDVTDVTDGPRCPGRRPLPGDTCDEALEGRSCTFGVACAAECVCERGSWVCANDGCTASCPAAVPAALPCAPSEVDRVCVYTAGCPAFCRCDATEGGARWSCAGPPC